MSSNMRKAKIVVDSDGAFYGIRFDCPGCKRNGFSAAHILPVDWTPEGYSRSSVNATQPTWGFNGNMEFPTFTPSILSQYEMHTVNGKQPFVCHSFITDGKIQFLSDCTHSLVGQTVDLPELEVHDDSDE